MSDDDAAARFVGEYERSVDDLREQDIVGRLAAWRGQSLANRLAWPVLALAFVAVTLFDHRVTAGCFDVPQSTPSWAPYQVWLWQCGSTETPSGLVWQDVWIFAA